MRFYPKKNFIFNLLFNLISLKSWKNAILEYFFGWKNAKIEENNKVIPIEIKGGKNYKRHSALNNLLNNDAFSIEKSYVFCNGNF